MLITIAAISYGNPTNNRGSDLLSMDKTKPSLLSVLTTKLRWTEEQLAKYRDNQDDLISY
ncbi:hypothetical protein Syn8016DRAFT_0261 [Synechococcus sp. WH 8016]|nr:hypothetical protein Syn8016DRAFT_0261 [Synechococcus sp. WH 8016]